MKNLFKISFLFFVLLMFILVLSSNAYNNINMDLPDTITNNVSATDNNIFENSLSSNTSTTSTISNPQVTITSTRDNDFFTIENILSVVIIVIGIILIFLGIAIIIRCK